MFFVHAVDSRPTDNADKSLLSGIEESETGKKMRENLENEKLFRSLGSIDSIYYCEKKKFA